MRALVVLALAGVMTVSLQAQTISTMAIDGLPTGLSADAIIATLDEKVGGVFVKTQPPADCATIASRLADLGYLDATVKGVSSVVPGGVHLTFAVTPHHLFTIQTV